MNEICLDREFENFYCPLTGDPVLMPEGYNITPALLFIYVEEVGDFEYCSEELRETFPQYFDENDTVLNPEQFLKEMKEDLYWAHDKLLITYGQTGSASLCFDMGYENGNI